MSINTSESDETLYAQELYPSVAAVASVYGDPHGTYAAFLNQEEPAYDEEPYFLWDQPLAPSNIVATNTSSSNGNKNGSGSNGAVALIDARWMRRTSAVIMGFMAWEIITD